MISKETYSKVLHLLIDDGIDAVKAIELADKVCEIFSEGQVFIPAPQSFLQQTAIASRGTIAVGEGVEEMKARLQNTDPSTPAVLKP